MTPDDRALAEQLRAIERSAGGLATKIEADAVPWPGQLQDDIRAMRKTLDAMDREVQKRRAPIRRGDRW